MNSTINDPTYSATEVLRIVREFDLVDCRSLMVIVDDEIDRYGVEDLGVLMQAAMVMFGRSVSVQFGGSGQTDYIRYALSLVRGIFILSGGC